MVLNTHRLQQQLMRRSKRKAWMTLESWSKILCTGKQQARISLAWSAPNRYVRLDMPCLMELKWTAVTSSLALSFIKFPVQNSRAATCEALSRTNTREIAPGHHCEHYFCFPRIFPNYLGFHGWVQGMTQDNKLRLLLIYAATHPEKLDAAKRLQWMKVFIPFF